MTHDESKPTYHYGRGGAGNVTSSKPDKSQQLTPGTTPTLKSKAYTTGRGGQGNIVENNDPETARMAQDVEAPGIVLPENSYHTGRGGGGNVYKPSEEEIAANRENNERLRSGGLKDKFKNMFSSSNKQEK